MWIQWFVKFKWNKKRLISKLTVSETSFFQYVSNCLLNPTCKILLVYNGGQISQRDMISMNIEVQTLCKTIDQYGIRNWNFWYKFYISQFITLEFSFSKKNRNVFSFELGTFNTGVISLKLLNPEVTPIFSKVPPLHELKEKVEQELDRL